MSDIKLTAKQKNKIKRAVKALNDVRQELEDKNPTKYVNWYLEDTANLNLMEDHSHDDNHNPNFDAIIDTFDLEDASGGGW